MKKNGKKFAKLQDGKIFKKNFKFFFKKNLKNLFRKFFNNKLFD
jgi:hypothetical protein